MNKLEKEIEDLDINIGLDNYILKYEELKKNLVLEEKNLKNIEKKFLQESKKDNKNTSNLSFDKILNKFEVLISNIDENDELETLIEYYKKARSLKTIAQKKIDDIQSLNGINLNSVN